MFGSDGSGRIPFEGRQIHHANRKIEREELRFPLDRARREGRGALLERYGIDGPEARQSGLEWKLESAGKYGCGRHGLSLGGGGPRQIGGGLLPSGQVRVASAPARRETE